MPKKSFDTLQRHPPIGDSDYQGGTLRVELRLRVSCELFTEGQFDFRPSETHLADNPTLGKVQGPAYVYSAAKPSCRNTAIAASSLAHPPRRASGMPSLR